MQTSGHEKKDETTILKKLNQVNKVLEDLEKSLVFRITNENGTQVLQLVDKNSNNKVLYQMPLEGIVEVMSKIQKSIGLIVDVQK